MSKEWLIGTGSFAQAMIREQQAVAGRGRIVEKAMRLTQEAEWDRQLAELLRAMGKTRQELLREGKSVPWKLALAAALKSRATVTESLARRGAAHGTPA